MPSLDFQISRHYLAPGLDVEGAAGRDARRLRTMMASDNDGAMAISVLRSETETLEISTATEGSSYGSVNPVWQQPKKRWVTQRTGTPTVTESSPPICGLHPYKDVELHPIAITCRR